MSDHFDLFGSPRKSGQDPKLSGWRQNTNVLYASEVPTGTRVWVANYKWRWEGAPESRVRLVVLPEWSEDRRRLLFDADVWMPYIEGHAVPDNPKTPGNPSIISAAGGSDGSEYYR